MFAEKNIIPDYCKGAELYFFELNFSLFFLNSQNHILQTFVIILAEKQPILLDLWY